MKIHGKVLQPRQACAISNAPSSSVLQQIHLTRGRLPDVITLGPCQKISGSLSYTEEQRLRLRPASTKTAPVLGCIVYVRAERHVHTHTSHIQVAALCEVTDKHVTGFGYKSLLQSRLLVSLLAEPASNQHILWSPTVVLIAICAG